MKKLLFPFIALLCISCSKEPESLANNDPSKYVLVSDIVWASPNGQDLTLDIYTPKTNKKNYPVIIIFHGGGWLINDKSIMNQMSQYLATNSEYVICNVNYRLLSDNNNTVTLDQIVEDAFGAVIWVKANISNYKGDKQKIAVTGDSAGAHLSAMIVNSSSQLSSNTIFKENLSFTPTYLLDGKTAEEVAIENGLSVQAAILSYGSFDIYEASLRGFETFKNPFWLFSMSKARGIFGDNFNAEKDPEMYKALSPIYNVPKAENKILPPQFFIVGTKDKLTTPELVKEYTKKLESFGHKSEYWEYEDKNHAFLDSGSSFEKKAPEAIKMIINFLDKVFKEE